MPTFPFMQVDAFTTQKLAGNPCAILFDCDELDDDTMLAIASEMNLSETSFVYNSDSADFGARYFTPGGEIPLAGHPTIATVYALVESGRLSLTDDKTEITLELQAGLIPIEIHAKQGKIENIIMTQIKPQFMAKYDPNQILPVFGLQENDLLEGSTIQTVSTGTPQLMIAVSDLKVLKRIAIDIPGFTQLHAEGDFFSAHLFCVEGVTPSGNTFARHFAPPPDLFEDPFTGSASGGMAAYLWYYGLIEKPEFVAEQGHWMNRPGQAMLEIVGPRENIQSVKITGQAITVIRGEFFL
jgi:trans-2,3-dihydro-3-hydroxyanthranilate isomerase